MGYRDFLPDEYLREHSVENVFEVRLRAYASERTARYRHHKDWFCPEDRLVSRTRRPIDGVLENAGNGIIVFRRDDHQPIRLRNGILERFYNLRLLIGIVVRE